MDDEEDEDEEDDEDEEEEEANECSDSSFSCACRFAAVSGAALLFRPFSLFSSFALLFTLGLCSAIGAAAVTATAGRVPGCCAAPRAGCLAVGTASV